MRARVIAVVLGMALAGTAAQAQVKVGILNSLSGPGASIGVPYAKGYAAFQAGLAAGAGEKLVFITIDDASDPAAAVRGARKLIEEDNIDVLVGAATTPATQGAYGVALEAKVPMIVVSNTLIPGERGDWEITVPQPVPLMIAADIAQMARDGVKTVAYIGFSDGWGDLVHDSLAKALAPAGMQLVANERYARSDTTVTPQILKIMALRPDAVFTGGVGSPAALPHLGLQARGYRGHIYSTHAVINTEFVRIAGASIEGMVAPAGPVVVAEQLPDSNPIKPVALRFRALFQQANKEASNDPFAAYAYDGMLILADAVKRAQGTPGTAAYRLALRDAIVTTTELVGTHGVYTYKPGERYGSDARARVIVRLDHGSWKLVE